MIGTVLIVFMLLLVGYVFVIMPRRKKRPSYKPLMGRYYAHRGLHDNKTDAPENSMAAFKRAMAYGYGIELDVQLTKDQVPVIFHDGTLRRVCGVPGKVQDYTYAQLQQFQLCNSQERIPLFADFLKMVDGKVPLIIELKAYEKAEVLCPIVDKLIREYRGVYCIESFDPRIVKWYRKHRPEVIRGQLSCNFGENGKPEAPHKMLIHYLLTNILCRPDFIAYKHTNKNNISRVLCRRLYNALSVAWTIRSQRELEACKHDFDLFIFEGFRPQ